MKIVYFSSPAELRDWFLAHHATETELLVGYYKKETGKPSITWPESVDEALCVGWIDGIRRRVDAESYSVRFTPRRPKSIWSAVNINRAGVLIAEGRMQPAGLKAFEARDENRSRIYSFERRREELDEPYASQFKQEPAAWEFYQRQPGSYCRAVNAWVLTAKTEPTRQKRLAQLIEVSLNRQRIPQFTRRKTEE